MLIFRRPGRNRLRGRALPDAEQAGEYANHVAVDEWGLAVEGDRGHGAGGISTDAFERLESFDRVGDLAVVLTHDGFRSVLQVACAGVVAESRPDGVDGRTAQTPIPAILMQQTGCE